MTDFQRERAALGQRLRELRLDVGLTGREFAELLAWQPSRVSRIETGKQTPTDADVEAWAKACSVPDLVSDLVASLGNLDGHYIEHRRRFRTGKAPRQRTFAKLESATSRIRNFETVVVPGLLQTAEYARYRFLTSIRYEGSGGDVDAAVAARMQRQQVLYSPLKAFHFVLDEAALRHRLCPAEVMHGQLDRLVSLATLRRVKLGVVPLDFEHEGKAPLHGFAIYDDATVFVEMLTAGVTLSEPSEVELYTSLFDEYARAARYGAEARALIVSVIAELSTAI